LLFVIYPTPEACKAYRDDLRSRAEAAGRDPDSVRVAPAVYVVVDETEEKAQLKLEQIESLANQTDSLTLLSEVFNYDFSQHPVDEPLSDEILASMTGLRGFLDRVIGLSGTKNPSVNDFIKASGRGTLSEFTVFSGTPVQVADQMESWFQAEACDGFVLAATHMPGAYEDFVNLVVPELQRRGLFRREYGEGTLRDNLGFVRP
jgi:alkanesulfonate monooxygenase SsuD/methylene tetrahydromethanopterin reductase-like flavin-dependent oxidoreductase (luciferase family)